MRAKLAADAWCAAFVTPKRFDYPAITDSTIRAITEGHHLQPETHGLIAHIVEKYQFLHPHIAFPDIHNSGGFDLVVGNPPWGRIKVQEKKWFDGRHPAITKAPNQAARRKLIARLETEDPALYHEFQAYRNRAERTANFIRKGGRYPLSAIGDINTYQIFADLMRVTGHRAGIIVPSGIATDDQTKDFFNAMVDRKALVSLYDFENRKKHFPIDSRYRFCLLTLSSERQSDKASFVFFAHEVADIDNPEKNFTLTPHDLTLFNPNTRTAPTFRNRRDAEITTRIYRRIPVLINEGETDGNPWQVSFQRMFDMSNDSELFRTRPQLEDTGWTLRGNHFHRGKALYVPLYVLAMIHQHDHRWATYENGKFRDVTETEKQDPAFVAQPQYWVPAAETSERIGDDRRWLFGWRRVARTTDIRTFIMSPHPRAGVGDSFFEFVLPPEKVHDAVPLTAAANSLIFDFTTRQKIGGTNMSYFYVRQLAVPSPDTLRAHQSFVEQRILELCYTAWDMAPFGGDLGWDGPPFRWDAQRRALIRAELDALMFRLYGIDRADADYILDTFAVLQKDDLKGWGEYRTKRLTLERYDAMVEADRSGQPYQTVLDPPPAHPSVAHDWSTQPDWTNPDNPFTR